MISTRQTGDNSLETFHPGRGRRNACHRVDDVRRSTAKWIHKCCRLIDGILAAFWFRHRRTSRDSYLTQQITALRTSSAGRCRRWSLGERFQTILLVSIVPVVERPKLPTYAANPPTVVMPTDLAG